MHFVLSKKIFEGDNHQRSRNGVPNFATYTFNTALQAIGFILW